ncbi:MAG: hypothetical protein KA314_04910 [Chloroflexi bacterium]|nr:hypothetical protein [Chloroflexota bacterium]
MGDLQMVIEMPEEEKAALINWYDAAAKVADEFTDACVNILVEKYGAIREQIHRDIFFDSALSKQMNGFPLPEPAAAVERAMQIWKSHLLGL